MKKTLFLIALTVMVLAIVPQVMAQSMYYETFNESTNQLVSKHWVSFNGNNMRSRMEHANSSDFTITVFDPTTTTITMYSFNARTKTYTRMTVSSAGFDIGTGMQRHIDQRETFLGDEMVEGRMCKHYRINFADDSVQEDWRDPTLNDLAIRSRVGNEPFMVKRNIRQGAQPAHLFEIPSDYREQAMPDLNQLQNLFNIPSR